MYAVCVTFKIKPGLIDSFMPAMQQQAKNSLDLEADCHQFDICTDPARPDEVFLYEIYETAEAFQVHLASEHFIKFDEATLDMVAEKTVSTYSTVL